MERWRTARVWVKGQLEWYPNYLVSTKGRVKNKTTGFLLEPTVRRRYLKVNLYNQYGMKARQVHRIVASTFLGKPPQDKEVNHKNGIKFDNNLRNFEYLTKGENIAHSHRLGLKNQKGEKHPRHKLTSEQVLCIRKLRKRRNRPTIERLRKHFNVSYGTIAHIINNYTWKHLLQEV